MAKTRSKGKAAHSNKKHSSKRKPLQGAKAAKRSAKQAYKQPLRVEPAAETDPKQLINSNVSPPEQVSKPVESTFKAAAPNPCVDLKAVSEIFFSNDAPPTRSNGMKSNLKLLRLPIPKSLFRPHSKGDDVRPFDETKDIVLSNVFSAGVRPPAATVNFLKLIDARAEAIFSTMNREETKAMIFDGILDIAATEIIQSLKSIKARFFVSPVWNGPEDIRSLNIVNDATAASLAKFIFRDMTEKRQQLINKKWLTKVNCDAITEVHRQALSQEKRQQVNALVSLNYMTPWDLSRASKLLVIPPLNPRVAHDAAPDATLEQEDGDPLSMDASSNCGSLQSLDNVDRTNSASQPKRLTVASPPPSFTSKLFPSSPATISRSTMPAISHADTPQKTFQAFLEETLEDHLDSLSTLTPSKISHMTQSEDPQEEMQQEQTMEEHLDSLSTLTPPKISRMTQTEDRQEEKQQEQIAEPLSGDKIAPSFVWKDLSFDPKTNHPTNVNNILGVLSPASETPARRQAIGTFQQGYFGYQQEQMSEDIRQMSNNDFQHDADFGNNGRHDFINYERVAADTSNVIYSPLDFYPGAPFLSRYNPNGTFDGNNSPKSPLSTVRQSLSQEMELLGAFDWEESSG